MNVVSAYALQKLNVKKRQESILVRDGWSESSGILGNADAMIGGDMNGHIGSKRRGYERIHRGYDFEDTNKARERVLDFALLYNLAVINTYFKREEH